MQPEARSVEKAIEDEVLSLMATTPLHRIRVTQLCRRASINRSTFYDHFDNVEGVAQRTQEHLLEELDGLARQVLDDAPNAQEVSRAFLTFFSEHRATLRALASNETAPAVLAALDLRLMGLFREAVLRSHPHAEGLDDDVLRFAAAGYYRFYLDVVMSEKPFSAEELERHSALMTRFCSAGLERCGVGPT